MEQHVTLYLSNTNLEHVGWEFLEIFDLVRLSISLCTQPGGSNKLQRDRSGQSSQTCCRLSLLLTILGKERHREIEMRRKN